MVFIRERVKVINEQLKKLSKVQSLKLNHWQIKDGNYIYPIDAENSSEPWKAFESEKMHWYGPDKHYWFKTSITVPENFEGKPLWLIIHTQIEEWDDAKNPQFLLFVNGKVTQGLDMNHREVLLTPCAKANDTYEIGLQAYTGTLHNEFRLIGELAEIDPRIVSLYYDIQIPLEALERMTKGQQLVLDLENRLNETVQRIDFRKVYSKTFYDSVKEASEYIKKAIYEDLAGYEDIIATCIGHTHIDVAWWWTVAQTREKVGRSFATVLKLMEEYPDYKFMSSQPQLYEFLKERYPELYEGIKQRVKEGRWEVEGGMWVEADCNLTSGESLVRQFIHGKRFFKEEFNKENKILWLPDVFGYSGALPQIMKKCGVDYFMTTKLAWNQFNKIPNDTFMWQGIDGTKILTHFITTLGVGQSTEDFFTTYNGMLHPDAIMGGWERYQNKEINNDILISFGYGDGGGGPTRKMLETSERMSKGVKGIPKVRQAFSRDYFEELNERVKKDYRLETWVGELYFEYHRGTYTSMARNKRSNRESEFMLMDLELLALLAKSFNKEYPTEALDRMWKKVLLNQFHDILPGSSIKEVYEVTREEYKQIALEAKALKEERMNAMIKPDEGITLFNTTGFVRNGLVTLKDDTAKALQAADGTLYAVQGGEVGAVAYIKGLPSKGYESFKPVLNLEEPINPFKIDNLHLATPYYEVQLDEMGCITSLYDKEAKREVILEGEKANQLRVYEDKPIYYDNWDIDIYYKQKYWNVEDEVEMKWVEKGPVRTALQIKKKFVDSIIEQTIYFYADTRRIDFKTYVDWKQNQHLLKVHFPIDVHTDEATFEIQFGNVTRKTHTNTSWDMARFESCAHKWMDVSEGDYGVSLLNNCKYGHSVQGTNIGLTLIKSGIEPNPTTDQEEHFFTYSLYPHLGTWKDAGTVKEAYDLNQPILLAEGSSQKEKYSFASVDQENVMLETIKQSEDKEGVIFRFYEYQNKRVQTTLSLEQKIEKVYECDLVENIIKEIPYEENKAIFEVKPYEIKTLKVIFK